MKTKTILAFTLITISTMLLAACAVPIPDAPTPDQPATKTIFVADHLAECTGVAPMMCMLIKENPEDDWQYFYDQIEGFEYEAGFEYELLIEETEIENPPADASSLRRTLVEIVSKTATMGGQSDEDEQQPDGGAKITGIVWMLRQLRGEALLPGSEITLEFGDDGQINGTAGCNSYFGAYEIDGDKLTFPGPMGNTEMFCMEPEGVMDQEVAFLLTFASAATFDMSDGRLNILDADGNAMMTLSPQQNLALEGTEWVLDSVLIGGDAVASVLNGTEITAIFEKGQVSGSAGCNNYFASYELNADGLSIGPAGATRKFCGEPENIMDQETHFLTGLERVVGFEIKGQSLQLFDADGLALFTFVAHGPEMGGESAEVGREGGLIGVTWRLENYGNPADLTEMLPDSEITLELGEGGQATGTSGCNSYFAGYSINGESIAITDAGMTMMACEQELMDQEIAYMTLLGSAFQFQQIDGKLTLFSGDQVLNFSVQ